MYVPYYYQYPPAHLDGFMIFANAQVMTINVTGSMTVSVTVTVHTP